MEDKNTSEQVDEVIRDTPKVMYQLNADEIMRLECLVLANAKPSMTKNTTEILSDAKKFFDFVRGNNA